MQVSLHRLEDFAKTFWELVNGVKVFAVHGEMGTGKTTTITALCKYKGVQKSIGSPTFSIINEYSFAEKEETKKIFHIDLYRLKDDEEVVQAGVEDCVYSNEICFVEWPEKAPFLFDEKALHILIQPVADNLRQVSILSVEELNHLHITEQL